MCFTCHKGERVRQFDIFGAPVGVTFNGEARYKTGLGGCVTLLLLVVFGSNMILSLINVVLNKSYSSTRSRLRVGDVYAKPNICWHYHTKLFRCTARRLQS